MEKCNICPRMCNVDRDTTLGFCLTDNNIRVNKLMIHMWEEPPISGTLGSFTIFFTGCNLGCIFCQNHEISRSSNGHIFTYKELKEKIYEVKDRCHNINFVTGSHLVHVLLPLLKELKEEKFPLPLVWNTSSYESVDTLKKLDGLIDIYLCDFKFYSSEISYNYARAKDYPEVAKKAIDEMFRQRGKYIINDDGLMESGLIIRHLAMPTMTEDTLDTIDYLFTKYKNYCIYSIMMQYTPTKIGKASKFIELKKKITKEEYERILNFTLALGVNNAYIQDIESSSEEFIPDFNKERGF